MRLVAIGDGQEGAQRQEEHQGKGDQDRPFDAVGAAHGVSTEGCWDWGAGGGAVARSRDSTSIAWGTGGIMGVRQQTGFHP